MRVNILYIIWSLGLGGAERVVINLAKGLDKARFNPMVCCLNEAGEFAAELESAGIKVIALHKKSKADITVIAKLITVITENNIQIVHTHLWGANFWGRIAAKFAKVPVIIATEHNVDIWKSGLNFILDRLLARISDKIIAVSQSVKGFYIKQGIPAGKIEVIYNGISLDPRCSILDARKSFGLSDGESLLAVVGRLVEQKGHRYLFEALSMLNGRRKVKLLVIGDGPEQQRLADSVQRLGLGAKIIFTGLRKDVREFIRGIDILVLPSLREGLPVAALEAMAAGKPVIATNVGGTPELISDGETGLLVKPADPLALSGALEKLLSDRQLAQTMGERGRKRVENYFSLAKMINETEKLYEECLSSNHLRSSKHLNLRSLI